MTTLMLPTEWDRQISYVEMVAYPTAGYVVGALVTVPHGQVYWIRSFQVGFIGGGANFASLIVKRAAEQTVPAQDIAILNGNAATGAIDGTLILNPPTPIPVRGLNSFQPIANSTLAGGGTIRFGVIYTITSG